MKYTTTLFCTVMVLLIGNSNQANSDVIPMKTTPLNKETIRQVLSIANYNNPVILEDAAYFSGVKIENYQNLGDYYQVQYYPEMPIENFPGVIRLSKHSVGIGETSFKTGSCNKEVIEVCRWDLFNLVTIETNIPKQIDKQSLKSFMQLGYNDFDDATLAYLLRIIRIPLKDVISESHEEFSIRDYQVSNELHDDINSYPIHGPENHYFPRTIRLDQNHENSAREYRIEYFHKTERYSQPISLIVKRLNIEGTKNKIRIVDGPIF